MMAPALAYRYADNPGRQHPQGSPAVAEGAHEVTLMSTGSAGAGRSLVQFVSLTAAQRSAVGEVFAGSHTDDPLVRHLFPEPARRAVVLGVFFTATRGQGSASGCWPGLASRRRPAAAVHLTTAMGENVRFYQRFGFQVVNEEVALVPGGPTHWGMRRPPADADQVSQPP